MTAHQHQHAGEHLSTPASRSGPAPPTAPDRSKPLAITLALVVAYMAAEIVGGIVSGSLALLADAGHMLSDAAALALTLFAMRFARKPPSASRTYGYHRAEILAALANGATLVAIAILIGIEAYCRFLDPPRVEGGLMLAIATGGLAVNLIGLWILRGAHTESLNVRGAWLHVLTDALGSVQAIAAAVLISAFGWNLADPVASVLIALLVAWSSWSLIRQSVDVLMEGVPSHLRLNDVSEALAALPGVAGVHDLHIWTITSGFVALSVHIAVPDADAHDTVLCAARDLLTDRFGIRHCTIQIDRADTCEQIPHAPV